MKKRLKKAKKAKKQKKAKNKLRLKLCQDQVQFSLRYNLILFVKDLQNLI